MSRRTGRDSYGDVSYGRQIEAFPFPTSGPLEAQHALTFEKLRAARHWFTEASLDEFEARGSTGRRWVHRATNRLFLRDESQVLTSANPRASGVEFFVVVGETLWFLRPADFDPVTNVIEHGPIYGRQLVVGEPTRSGIL